MISSTPKTGPTETGSWFRLSPTKRAHWDSGTWISGAPKRLEGIFVSNLQVVKIGVGPQEVKIFDNTQRPSIQKESKKWKEWKQTKKHNFLQQILNQIKLFIETTAKSNEYSGIFQLSHLVSSGKILVWSSQVRLVDSFKPLRTCLQRCEIMFSSRLNIKTSNDAWSSYTNMNTPYMCICGILSHFPGNYIHCFLKDKSQQKTYQKLQTPLTQLIHHLFKGSSNLNFGSENPDIHGILSYQKTSPSNEVFGRLG